MVRKKFIEVKNHDGIPLSKREKEFKDANPRKHKTVYQDADNPLHTARELGRDARKFFKKLS